MTEIMQRETFSTSRLLDFCSEKDLQAQTGHETADWPLVIVKEGIDNALDGCEETDTPPVVSIVVDDDGITVEDNGPGIPAATVESLLDFSIRVSSRAAYVSPTRGAQGNALKTLIAMPFVLSGGHRGSVEIEAPGLCHHIDFAVDHIRQAPIIGYRTERSDRKNGTRLRIGWPNSASSILNSARSRFLQIADDYCWLNPHLTLSVEWFGDRQVKAAINPAWAKWKTSDPTSPHWYSPERQQRLVAAQIVLDADNGRDRPVREFVAQFRGLSGTAKQKAVLETVGLSRAPLSALVSGGVIDASITAALFDAMKAQSKLVPPKLLGPIGRDHFESRCRDLGCVMESFDYRKVEEIDDEGLPALVETAFAWRGDIDDGRRDVVGVNWSPGITNPFRVLGGYGQSLDTILERQRVNRDEPVIFVLHVSCPRVDYLDRGKSSVAVRP